MITVKLTSITSSHNLTTNARFGAPDPSVPAGVGPQSPAWSASSAEHEERPCLLKRPSAPVSPSSSSVVIVIMIITIINSNGGSGSRSSSSSTTTTADYWLLTTDYYFYY